MDRASADEKARRVATAAAAAEAAKKRPLSASNETPDAKRQKLEKDSTNGTSAAFLAGFDFTSLPVALITELVVANLLAFTEPALVALVEAYRESRGASAAPVAHAPSAVPEQAPATAQVVIAPPVKQEPIDPLKMDIDEDEMEYEPDKLNLEVWYTIYCF
jgi:symplekin